MVHTLFITLILKQFARQISKGFRIMSSYTNIKCTLIRSYIEIYKLTLCQQVPAASSRPHVVASSIYKTLFKKKII